MTDPISSLGALTPAALDGHTIDQLQDYLDAGREPRDPSIEESAACQIALAALTRLRLVSRAIFDADVAAQPPVDASWVSGIMDEIGREARAGRRIPLEDVSESVDVGVTEGALLGAVRTAGDDDPDVLVGRCRLIGDVTIPDAPIAVELMIAVRWGRSLAEAAEETRTRVRRALEQHTRLSISRIDVRVGDLWGIPHGTETDQ